MTISVKRIFRILAAMIILHSAVFSIPARGLQEPFDHSAWDQFLKKFVSDQGEVNFQSAKSDASLLTQYLDQLSKINLQGFFSAWPREEKLALWLNAYHAGVIKIVLEHYPVKSVHDIPGVWDLPLVKIGEKHFSLNEIRTGQLMEIFRDEKIHVALACGARSCPRFRREAFTGPRVEGQLFLATRDFVNDQAFNQIEPGRKAILISRLFKWYEHDFTLDFGATESIRNLSPEEGAVLSFIAHYLEDPAKLEYLEEGKYKIKYLPFEWALNEWRAASS